MHALHKYHIRDCRLKPNREFIPPEHQEGAIIYEVIRVIQAKLLFFEDHMTRFHHALEVKGWELSWSDQQILICLHDLIRSNGEKTGNIKYLIHHGPEDSSFLAYFIPHRYPSAKEYREGIRTDIFRWERVNPNIKQWSGAFRNLVSKFIQQENIYEAILVDDRDLILEGSRSNIYFCKGKNLFTPPPDRILKGITRKYVQQICRDHGIGCRERDIRLQEIDRFEGCFISGTSPAILPIRELGKQSFDPNLPLIRSIAERYREIMMQNLR